MSTWLSTSSARSVMSRMFPIGVATTYNVRSSTARGSLRVVAAIFSMVLWSVLARTRAAALLALALGAASCTVSPPLSGPRDGAATVRPAPAVSPPAMVPAPVLPAPSLVPPAVPLVETRPLPPAPGIPAASDTIALMLPIQSPAYARAAEAVKAGFLAAANRAGVAGRVRVIGHGDDGVLPAFALAEQQGAALVVGPLTR